MKSIRLFIVLAALCSAVSFSFAQDSLVTEIAMKNLATFSKDGKTFTGEGWNTLIGEVQKSDFVLIGEDHFTNEIPFFVSAITNKVKFDNFFCEIDPYSAKIIESKIKNLSDEQLKKYVADFGNVFSFYSLEPELQLMKQLVKSNTTIYGTDQILMIADRLICSELKKTTKNAEAKTIYESIEANSKNHFAEFLKDQGKPMYMLTDDFEKQVNKLQALNVSKEEKEIIERLELTAKIYKEQNHHLRIQLMKNQLLQVNSEWQSKKNLFKFGAVHLAKGESLFKIYDIGNLVNNIADSRYKSSLHILIVGKSGTQGSPFKGFPERTVDENSDDLKPLKPLFNIVNGEQWYCFNMQPLRKAAENGEAVIKDITLSRIINGYDFVVIIPQVTAAKFPETE